MSTSDLNAMVSLFERIRHLRRDVQEITLSSFLDRESFLCQRSNFDSSQERDFFYLPGKKDSTFSTLKPIMKSISQVEHLSTDIQNYVLMTLYSNVSLQSPEINFGPEIRPLIALRRISTSTLTVRPESPIQLEPTPPKEEPSSKQVYDLALSSGILKLPKTTPSFTTLFPGTSWPHVTHILGTPRIEPLVFNTLLISLMRQVKTAIRSSRFACPKRLPDSIRLALSRMIYLSIEKELAELKSRSRSPSPLPKQTSSKTSKQPATERKPKTKVNFVTSSPETSGDEALSSSLVLFPGLQIPNDGPEALLSDDSNDECFKDRQKAVLYRAALSELESRSDLRDISDSPLLTKIFFSRPEMTIDVNYGTNEHGISIRAPERLRVVRHPNFPNSLASYSILIDPATALRTFPHSMDFTPFITFLRRQIALIQSRTEFGFAYAMSSDLF
jgi:hypothetical protein